MTDLSMRTERHEDEEREAKIARRITYEARPLAEKVLRRFAGSEALTAQDAEDLIATVMMRLVARLRAEDDIDRFADYVARLTFNAVSDHFRSRYPGRTQLRNRIRYALSHDRRLAIWTIREQLAGGLGRWRGASSARGEAMAVPDSVAILRGDRPADALVELFRIAGEPFYLQALVETFAPNWQPQFAASALRQVDDETPLVRLEWRELLTALWSEIAQLRPLQRKALLLNLRDAETSHALSLFVLTRTASIEQVAQALEMTTDELSSIWNELPLDDLRIAARLQLTREKVISLRKSARERLTRRLARLRTP